MVQGNVKEVQGLERFDVLDLCSGWRKCNSSPPDLLDAFWISLAPNLIPARVRQVHHSVHRKAFIRGTDMEWGDSEGLHVVEDSTASLSPIFQCDQVVHLTVMATACNLHQPRWKLGPRQ